MFGGNGQRQYKEFKEGKFKFSEKFVNEDLPICWDTINYVRSINGRCVYMGAAKFWRALVCLVNHEEFDGKKWMMNVQKHVTKFCCMASTKDYLTFFQTVYNYQNRDKISLKD